MPCCSGRGIVSRVPQWPPVAGLQSGKLVPIGSVFVVTVAVAAQTGKRVVATLNCSFTQLLREPE